MKVRVLYNTNGSVSVILPAAKSRRAGESEAQWLARVFDKANPDNLPYKDMDSHDLPVRRFRNAWIKGPGRIEVGLAKAKEQVMRELRATRDEELNRTDGLMARANELESHIEINKMRVYRQKLRDLPQTIGVEKIKTVKQLEKAYPRKMPIDNYLDLADSIND